MGVFRAPIDFKFLNDLPAKSVMRNHSFHRMLHHILGPRLNKILERFEPGTSRIAGVMEQFFQLGSFAREFDLLGIDDNNEITEVEIRCELRLVFAAENSCNV